MAVTIGTGEIRGARHVVRTSAGNVYVVMEDGGKIHVFGGVVAAGPYYFDASDAGPSDPDGVWVNDSRAFTNDLVFAASTDAGGTEATNELRGEGTNAPSSGITIDRVLFRVSHTESFTSLDLKIYTDGEGESLLTYSGKHSSKQWSPWYTIAEPAGGWSWSAVQSLEIIFWYVDSGYGYLYGQEFKIINASSTPTEFLEMDGANAPSTGGLTDAPCACAIDSDDVIHVVYYRSDGTNNDLYYCKFHTIDSTAGTDTWDSPEIAIPQVDSDNATFGCAIAVDSADKPHACYVDSDSAKGTDYETIYYANKTGVAWSTPMEIEGVSNTKKCTFPDIAINSDNYPVIVYLNDSDDTIDAVEGDANDPTTFATREVDGTALSGATNKPSICVDSNGDAWVAYVDADNTIDIAEQSANWTDAWTIQSNGNGGQEPSIVADGTDIYVFYEEDLADDIVYDKYDGGWLGETQLQTSVAYNSVKARWAYNHLASFATYGIDYVFDDGTNILWDNLSIAAPPTGYRQRIISIF